LFKFWLVGTNPPRVRIIANTGNLICARTARINSLASPANQQILAEFNAIGAAAHSSQRSFQCFNTDFQQGTIAH
jgi:hypothetical protein